ncbi:unnamed protein product [[Candida] boidinii]|nr:unnamed protein product [[Candida] boidinii]
MVYPITINSCEVPVPYFEQELSEVERQFQIKTQGHNQHEKKEKSNKKKKRLNISLNFDDENEDENENGSLQFEPATKKKHIEDDDGNEQDDVLNFNKVSKTAKKFKMKSSHDLLNDKNLKKEVTKKSKFNQNDKTEMILKEDKIKDEDTNSIKDTKIAINIKVEENANKDALNLHGDENSPQDLDQKGSIPVTKDKEIRDRNTLDKLKEFQKKLNVAGVHNTVETVARREEENSSEADYGDGLSEEEDDLDFWKEKLVFKDS